MFNIDICVADFNIAVAALLVNRILVRAALKAGVLDAMAEWLVLICCITQTCEL